MTKYPRQIVYTSNKDATEDDQREMSYKMDNKALIVSIIALIISFLSVVLSVYSICR
jgi:hypothetical protein